MMTHEAMIEVIQAHKDGKPVQRRFLKEGQLFEDMKLGDIFDFGRFEFRIKPEDKKPREWLVVARPDGSIAGGDIAKPWACIKVESAEDLRFPTIRVREVLE